MKRFLILFTAGLAVLLIAGVLVIRSQAEKIGTVAPVEGTDGIFSGRNLIVDMYAAEVGDEVVLFGAGLDTTGTALDGLLTGSGFGGRERVHSVFVTHGHPDHVNGIPLLPRARIYIGASDVDQNVIRVPPRTFFEEILEIVFIVAVSKTTDTLTGAQEIPVGNLIENVYAIPFPGHTLGSYVFVFRNILFTGDSFNLIDGQLELPSPDTAVDFEQFLESTLALPVLLEGRDVTMICTGHGGCTPQEEPGKLIEELVMLAKSQSLPMPK